MKAHYLIRIAQYGIPLFLFFVFAFFYGFNGLYGQDSHFYSKYAQDLSEWFGGGQYPIPIDHALYSFIGAVCMFLGLGSKSLLFISLIAFGVSIFLMEKIGSEVFGLNQNNAKLYSLFFLGISPFLFRNAYVQMTESTCIAFLLAAMLFFYRGIVREKNGAFLWFALFTGLAIGTRKPVLLVLLPPILYSIYFLIKKKQTFILIRFMGAFGLFVLLPNLILNNSMSGVSSQLFFLEHWNFKNFLSLEHHSPDGQLVLAMPNIAFNAVQLFSPGFLLLFIPALYFLLRQKRSLQVNIALIAGLLYFLFLCGLDLQNKRILMPAVIMLALASASTFNNFIDFIPVKYKRAFLSLLILVQVALCAYAFTPFYNYQQAEKRMVAELNQKSKKEKIFTIGFEGPLWSYTDKEVISLWEEPQSLFDDASVLLVNDYKLKAYRGAGDPVFDRIERLKRKHQLIQTDSLGRGWNLYVKGN